MDLTKKDRLIEIELRITVSSVEYPEGGPTAKARWEIPGVTPIVFDGDELILAGGLEKVNDTKETRPTNSDVAYSYLRCIKRIFKDLNDPQLEANLLSKLIEVEEKIQATKPEPKEERVSVSVSKTKE